MDARVADGSGTGIPAPLQMEELLRQLMRGVNAMIYRDMGSEVRVGPFKGMAIPPPEEEAWCDGNFSCKVLGTYEHELHDVVAHAVSRKPASVVNVGCADGFYAVGLARLLPQAWVWALDANAQARVSVAEYAKRNGVADRISIAGECRDASGLSLGSGHRLYVIDVEGDELKLVDPSRCEALARSDLVIECHDFVNQNISLTLADRLARTHAIEIVRARLPLYGRYEFLNQSPGIMQVLAVTEKRPMPSLWLACWALQRGD